MNHRIVYNVTVKIESGVQNDWLKWMTEKHIPDVMKTGCFLSYRMSRIMEEPDEHGTGYAIQYISPDMEKFKEYVANHATKLQQEHSEMFKSRYVAFRTLLEIVDEG